MGDLQFKGLYIGQKNNNFAMLSQIIVFSLPFPDLIKQKQFSRPFYGLEFQNKIPHLFPDRGNPVHNLIGELEASIIASVQSIALALIKVKDDAILPLTRDRISTKDQLA